MHRVVIKFEINHAAFKLNSFGMIIVFTKFSIVFLIVGSKVGILI